MIRCSFTLPLESWRFKEDIFDHMTIATWKSCKGENCTPFKDFINDIRYKLNNISHRKGDNVHLWDVSFERYSPYLEVFLKSSNDDISIEDFKCMIENEIIPIFSSVVSCKETLVFRDNYLNNTRIIVKNL